MKCYSYVRFSSPEQAKGSSHDRQIEIAKNYAKKRGWELDESFCMFDPGLSGFHQEHRTRGKLGVFLTAVKKGKVPTPSALLVENLDRLSRATIPQALRQFLDLIESGITIVTLIDEQEYSKTSLEKGIEQILISIAIMSRAHEESKTKQFRRSKAWDREKEKARRSGYKIPAHLPGWLRLSVDKQRFEVIEEKAEVVRRIYSLYLSGKGIASICKELNQNRIQTFSSKSIEKPGTWGSTIIEKVLTSRTVIGEMQFFKSLRSDDGKKVLEVDGEPILDYYPPIIDEATFLRVQNEKLSRYTPFGRVGEANNLFSGIAKCGYCSSTMMYGVRGRKKHQYLKCSNARVSACPGGNISFRYADFEEAFLEECQQLDLENLLTSETDEQNSRIQSLNDLIGEHTARIAESERKLAKYEKALTDETSTDEDIVKYFTPKISSEIKYQRECNERIVELKREVNKLSQSKEEASKSLEGVKLAIEEFKNMKGNDREEFRKKLQYHIRSIVTKIEFFPFGSRYLQEKELLNNKEFPDDMREFYLRRTGINPKTGQVPRTNNPARKNRSVTIYFKGGGVLCFMNDYATDKLVVGVETEPGEEFELTNRSREGVDRVFKENQNNENDRLERTILDKNN